jgi:hypothetical protein
MHLTWRTEVIAIIMLTLQAKSINGTGGGPGVTNLKEDELEGDEL